MGNNTTPWDYDTTATYPDADLRSEADVAEMTATERAVMVGYEMGRGWQPTTNEVQAVAGYKSHTGAFMMMCRASRRAPVFWDEGDGRWKPCKQV